MCCMLSLVVLVMDYVDCYVDGDATICQLVAVQMVKLIIFCNSEWWPQGPEYISCSTSHAKHSEIKLNSVQS